MVQVSRVVWKWLYQLWISNKDALGEFAQSSDISAHSCTVFFHRLNFVSVYFKVTVASSSFVESCPCDAGSDLRFGVIILLHTLLLYDHIQNHPVDYKVFNIILNALCFVPLSNYNVNNEEYPIRSFPSYTLCLFHNRNTRYDTNVKNIRLEWVIICLIA